VEVPERAARPVAPGDASRARIESERAHEDGWYRRAIAEGFFEREGFRRLVAWNFEALCRAVPLGPHVRALSIGCGMGEYEVRLAARVAHVTGVDLSALAVEAARERARRTGTANVEFRVGAVEDLRLEDGRLDLVYAFGVLHHIPTREARRAVLDLAHRALAPGGHLYVRDPSARGLPGRLGYWFFRNRARIHSPNEAHLDPIAMRDEVEHAGFHDVRIDYTDVIGGPLPWVTGTASPLVWDAVAAFDRLWLATPWLRERASQFAVIAHKGVRS
jgi:SAM-dependent methyltransferase